MIMQRYEEPFVFHDLGFPIKTIHCLELIELFGRKLKPVPRNTFVVGDPTDRRFLALRPSSYAIHDPFQNTNVLAEARPQKLALSIFPEPVDVEDPWSNAQCALHFNPVSEVVAHVITAKGKHRHWITAYFSDCARRRRCSFRTHRG